MAHPPSAWLQEYEKAAWGTPANENPYENVPVGTPSVNGDGWSFPALFHTKKEHKSFWFLLTEAGVTKDYCGTRLQGTVTACLPLHSVNDKICVYVTSSSFFGRWHV